MMGLLSMLKCFTHDVQPIFSCEYNILTHFQLHKQLIVLPLQEAGGPGAEGEAAA